MSWPKGNTQGSGPGPPGRGRPNGRSGHPWMPQSGESEYPSLSTAAGLPRTAGGNADARRHPSRAPTGPTPPRPGSDHASRSVSRQPRGPRAPFPPTMMAQSPYQRVSVPAQMMPLLSPPVAMGYPYPMNSGQYIRPPIGMAQLPMMPPHPVFYNPPPPPSVEPPQEAPTRTIQGPYAKEVASFLLDEGHKEELEANKFGVTVEFLHSSGWKDEVCNSQLPMEAGKGRGREGGGPARADNVCSVCVSLSRVLTRLPQTLGPIRTCRCFRARIWNIPNRAVSDRARGRAGGFYFAHTGVGSTAR